MKKKCKGFYFSSKLMKIPHFKLLTSTENSKPCICLWQILTQMWGDSIVLEHFILCPEGFQCSDRQMGLYSVHVFDVAFAYILFFPQQASERLLGVMSNLSMSAETAPVLPVQYEEPGRHLQLLSCTESEVLPYCVQLLLTCCKVSGQNIKAL